MFIIVTFTTVTSLGFSFVFFILSQNSFDTEKIRNGNSSDTICVYINVNLYVHHT